MVSLLSSLALHGAESVARYWSWISGLLWVGETSKTPDGESSGFADDSIYLTGYRIRGMSLLYSSVHFYNL